MQGAQTYLEIVRRLTGEPDDRETVTSGSEGGGWKSAHTLRVQGNSLAAYPTVSPVLF